MHAIWWSQKLHVAQLLATNLILAYIISTANPTWECCSCTHAALSWYIMRQRISALEQE